MTFFTCAGYSSPHTRVAADYLPGDIAARDLGRGPPPAGGTPLVLHNIGPGAREEDILFRYTIIGHYRLPPPPAGTSAQATASTH